MQPSSRREQLLMHLAGGIWWDLDTGWPQCCAGVSVAWVCDRFSVQKILSFVSQSLSLCAKRAVVSFFNLLLFITTLCTTSGGLSSYI